MGRDVLDGNGLAVSEAGGVVVKVSVDVTETVCGAVAAIVLTTGANDVLVGRLVSTKVGGIGVAVVNVQANDVSMHTMEKISFRLISQVYSPRRIIYLNNSRVKESGHLFEWYIKQRVEF